LNDCRDKVRNLLLKKRHVVEGIRDALLEREELIGDAIEALMADLGEREPIEIPVLALASNGGPAIGAGVGAPAGNGHQGGNGNGRSSTPPPPPPPLP
jgi:hypothetical protein